MRSGQHTQSGLDSARCRVQMQVARRQPIATPNRVSLGGQQTDLIRAGLDARGGAHGVAEGERVVATGREAICRTAVGPDALTGPSAMRNAVRGRHVVARRQSRACMRGDVRCEAGTVPRSMPRGDEVHILFIGLPLGEHLCSAPRRPFMHVDGPRPLVLDNLRARVRIIVVVLERVDRPRRARPAPMCAAPVHRGRCNPPPARKRAGVRSRAYRPADACPPAPADARHVWARLTDLDFFDWCFRGWRLQSQVT